MKTVNEKTKEILEEIEEDGFRYERVNHNKSNGHKVVTTITKMKNCYEYQTTIFEETHSRIMDQKYADTVKELVEYIIENH